MIDAQIVVDSSANMAGEFSFVSSVPLKIITDHQEYVDDAELNTTAMVWDLHTYTGKSSTACPAPPGLAGRLWGQALCVLHCYYQ